MPIPVESTSRLRLGFAPNPSLVLAPESALRLLPSRALSSAPVACSVFAGAVLRNHETKKSLNIAALSDMLLIRSSFPERRISGALAQSLLRVGLFVPSAMQLPVTLFSRSWHDLGPRRAAVHIRGLATNSQLGFVNTDTALIACDLVLVGRFGTNSRVEKSARQARRSAPMGVY